ncbi:hypothetical protein F5876DRAFT_79359 [Lentinula aff. lateritia]|uniref:Uncharacterized protein n=1 Tax=Lentinula aff. lateritia TaxID=2804960 RepID=A0ACC1TSW6_9AGAR|nr:hypothetical protein F5876DRAFT_79359 [Lentinula aff. lateritia]
MRVNIIHLPLGLASVVYAAPVMHTVSVTTAPVTHTVSVTTAQATIRWGPFGSPPIKLEYKYVPPAGEEPQKDHEPQKDNDYADYADDVVDTILEHQGERKKDVPFTWDPRKFAFEILTPIRVFDVVCPCIVDVNVYAKRPGAPAQAKSSYRGSSSNAHSLNEVPSLPVGLDPQAPTSRPTSPAPASPHSPGEAHSSGSAYSFDSYFPVSPHSPGSPHSPDLAHFSDITHSPDSPYSPGSPASDASDGHQHVHVGGYSVNRVGNIIISGNASFHVGNTYRY